jgi:site-specific DNA-cytosine methylase
MSPSDLDCDAPRGLVQRACSPSHLCATPGARNGNGAGGGAGGVKSLRVLIACEYSGTVRDAFAALGHDALSCDLLPSEKPGKHYQGDVRDVLEYPWDILIAHPPCTHLSVSGAKHFEAKRMDGRQHAAVSFFMRLALANVPRIAVENPVCIMSSLWRKPDQTIQPWQFGHGETKATCLWLKGLPPLKPTNIVAGREARVHRMPPSEDRWKERSRTFEGVAHAMASQWSAWAAGVGSWFGDVPSVTEAKENDPSSPTESA